ncbi:MAG: protein kinase, partial [Bacteroidota bacterium]
AKLRGASRLTKEGSTVGTAGYMSPEQVQGLDTDHRSDIFSLGVLLYELLAGQLPFKGVHETAMAYEIVNVDVQPMVSIKPDMAPEIDAIVLECLEKDPKERTQSAGQVAVDLRRFKRSSSRTRMSRTMPARTMSGVQAPAPRLDLPGGMKSRLQYLPWGVTAMVVLFALAWILIFQKTERAPVNHLNITAATSPDQLIYHSDVPSIAISPNGRLLVYTISEGGITQLYGRSLDSYEAHPLRGTANGSAPFFSPDGQWIGFVADGKIKKIPANGGTVETLCDATGFRGASWGPDNTIYFAPLFSSGLMAIPSTGGEPKPISILDSTKGERTHRWPQVLPGGKWILYTIGGQANPNSYVDAVLVIQSIETGERHELNVRGEMACYVEPGYLVVGRNASLLAAPFSLDDLKTKKPLSTIVDGVNGDQGSGVYHFSVSSDGNLVYVSGTLNKDFQLVWVTRDGKVTPLPLQAQPFNTPRLSPDNSRLAYSVGVTTGDNDIWIYDFKKEVSNRLTFTKTVNSPLWSLDGKNLYFASAIPLGIMVQPADGSSQGTFVLKHSLPVFPAALADKGKKLITSSLGANDIMIADLEKGTGQMPLIKGQPYAYGGSVSPDGRFISYGSNEASGLDIFVRSLPDLKGKWQISVGGGLSPVWSPRGDEIFYISTVGKMMAVSIKYSPTFSYGPPRELFDVSQMSFPNNPVTNYDVSKDGKRFVMVQNTTSGTRTSSFNYVQNWIQELEKKGK